MTELELDSYLASLTPTQLQEASDLCVNAKSVLVDPSFQWQTDFIRDEERMKLLLCTRRAGKSFGLGIDLLETGFRFPECNLLYLALTKQQAVGIMWKDVFHALDDKYNLGITFKETDHSLEFPNGSRLYMSGVDSDESERKKLFGKKYKKVAADEAGTLSIDIRDLVYGTIQPCLWDEQGTFLLAGMPGNVKVGLFFEATESQNPSNPGTFEYLDNVKDAVKWKGYRWTAAENPHMAAKFAFEIAAKRLLNPNIDQVPSFQNMYLGKWATDESLLVYRFNRSKNLFDGTLPPLPDDQWHYVLGVDLGFNDPTAFTVLAWHPLTKVTYVLLAYKRPGWTYTQVADEAKKLNNTFHFDTWVIDGADKQGVEEMRKHHQVPWKAAQKQGKAQTIELMNAEFLAGNIQVNEAMCKDLIDEYPSLIWISDTKQTEHPGCENNCSDSTNYAWKASRAYTSMAPPVLPKYGSPEFIQSQSDQMFRIKQEEARTNADRKDRFSSSRFSSISGARSAFHR